MARGAWIKLEDGTVVHVYGDFPPPKQCHNCHRTSTRLCDWKIGQGRTCDKPICPSDGCGSSPAPGKDLCRLHTTMWAQKQKPKLDERKEPDAGATGSKGQQPLL